MRVYNARRNSVLGMLFRMAPHARTTPDMATTIHENRNFLMECTVAMPLPIAHLPSQTAFYYACDIWWVF